MIENAGTAVADDQPVTEAMVGAASRQDRLLIVFLSSARRVLKILWQDWRVTKDDET